MPEITLNRIGDLLREGRFADAEVLVRQRLADAPDDPQLHFLLGAAHHAQGRQEPALQAFERALRLDPGLDQARRATATLLLELQRPQEALQCLEAGIQRRPASADFFVDAAIVLESLGEAEAALARYGGALQLCPSDFRARLNRGTLLARLGRLSEALHDDQKLARSHAGSADAHDNLADVLLRMGRHAEALAAAERALRLAPQRARTWMLRGLILAMLARDDEARASFAQATERDPQAREVFLRNAALAAGAAASQALTLDPRQIRLTRLLEQQKACDWRQRDRLVGELTALAAELSIAPHALQEMGLYHTALSLPIGNAEQQALACGLALGLDTAAEGLARATGGRRQNARIRLGFLSPDFREHPAAQLHWRQLALQDRARFEIFAYSLHDAGGALRQKVVASCDAFAEVSSLSDAQIAERIRHDGIDILIDLTGHMDYSRPAVLARRPAALRVSYMGFPATLGSALVDYRITDRFVTPSQAEAFWSEKLVFLPDTLWIYNDQEPIARQAPDRRACQLPERGFVFCCFNASYKIEPDVFAIWMRLLARVDGSVLWLVDGGPLARENLLREARSRGVAPQRLIFAPRLPRAEHLARHAHADLFLDTFYYGAHTTAADALWAGLPVLSCAGETMAARLGAGLVRAAGLPELVVDNAADYEARALQLACHPQELGALRARLQQQRHLCPTFNTHQRVRELDAAFAAIWRRHEAGLAPESFAVPRQAG